MNYVAQEQFCLMQNDSRCRLQCRTGQLKIVSQERMGRAVTAYLCALFDFAQI